jgi:CDP-glucose 4,6-dehydratase
VTPAFWRDRRVLLTGHTGFKGSWLTLLLERLGAVVTGYSLAPEGDRSLFTDARVSRHVHSVLGDLRDLASLRAAAVHSGAEIIFHLAAQPLVLRSYEAPLDTFSTNVMGTANLLEVVRTLPTAKAVVVVTTDKVYRNHEWPWPYRETDELGGRDPYASSKACAEIVTSSYRDSFLSARGVATATARAGNVIGGGDWAADRIVPDFVRAAASRQRLVVRNPESTRPWQHLFEPLEGYLLLAERLVTDPSRAEGAWNFGPPPDAVQPVRRLVEDLTAGWAGESSWGHERSERPHEATLLTLDSSKARRLLGWTPRIGYEGGLRLTIDWYKAAARGDDLEAVTLAQIETCLAGAPGQEPRPA